MSIASKTREVKELFERAHAVRLSKPARTGAYLGGQRCSLRRKFGSGSVRLGIVCMMSFSCLAQTNNHPHTPEVQAWTEADKDAQRVAGDAMWEDIREAVSNQMDCVSIPIGNYRWDTSREIANAHNLTIDFNQSTLWLEGNGRQICISACSNLTIRNLNIDFDTLHFFQGVIESFTGEYACVVSDPGYEDAVVVWSNKFAEGGRFAIWNDEGRMKSDFITGKAHLHEQVASNRFVFSVVPYVPYSLETACIEVGDRITIPTRWAPLIKLANGTAFTTLEDVKIYHAAGIAVREDHCYGGTTLRRVDVVKPPNTSRLVTSCADGFHFLNGKHGPLIDDCILEYLGDDPINVHGYYAYVLQQIDGDSYYTTKLSGQSVLDLTGEVLTAYNGRGKTVLGQSVLESCRLLDPGEITPSLTEALVEAKDAYPSAPGIEEVTEVNLTDTLPLSKGMLISLTDRWGNGFTVTNCQFRHCHGRGIVVQACNGRIVDNLFEWMPYGAVLMQDHNYWLEAGLPHDIWIERNVMRDMGLARSCRLAVKAYMGACIASSYGEFDRDFKPYEGIVVLDNYFERPAGAAIWINNARSIWITGNTIDTPNILGPFEAGRLLGVDPRYAMLLVDCQDYELFGNVITNRNPLDTLDSIALVRSPYDPSINMAPWAPVCGWSYLYKLDDGLQSDDCVRDGNYTPMETYLPDICNSRDTRLYGLPVQRWKKPDMAAAIEVGTPTNETLLLSANGTGSDDLRVLRWTAPIDGVVCIDGTLSHDANVGDILWELNRNSSTNAPGELVSGLLDDETDSESIFRVLYMNAGDTLDLISEHVDGSGLYAALGWRGTVQYLTGWDAYTSFAHYNPAMGWSCLYKLDDGSGTDDCVRDGNYIHMEKYLSELYNSRDTRLNGLPVQRWKKPDASIVIDAGRTAKGEKLISFNGNTFDDLRILRWESPVDGLVCFAGTLTHDALAGDILWSLNTNSCPASPGIVTGGVLVDSNAAHSLQEILTVKEGDCVDLVCEHKDSSGSYASLGFNGFVFLMEAWDPAREFSFNSPAAQWSFLYKEDDGPADDDCTRNGEYTVMQRYFDFVDNSTDTRLQEVSCRRYRNDERTSYIDCGTPSGEGEMLLSFIPKTSDDLTVLRWTSPFTGTARMFADLTHDGKAGDTIWGLYHNNTLIDDGILIDSNSVIRLDESLDVLRGETVDFVVEHKNGTGQYGALGFRGGVVRTDLDL